MLQELRGKLLAEAEQSARHNAAVAMRWADLFSIEVPQDLYQEIEKQRQSCQKLISSKDKLITGGTLKLFTSDSVLAASELWYFDGACEPQVLYPSQLVCPLCPCSAARYSTVALEHKWQHWTFLQRSRPS